jgi:hypothetical protein
MRYEMDSRSSIPNIGRRFFSSPQPPNRLWGPTQPPIRRVSGNVSPALKRREREAGHSLTSSAEVKNYGAIPPSPICLHGIVLNYIIKHRETLRLNVISQAVIHCVLWVRNIHNHMHRPIIKADLHSLTSRIPSEISALQVGKKIGKHN